MVSAGTVAGRELAGKRLTGLAEEVFFVPFDLVFAVRAVLRRVRPHVLVVMETEIWPNLWREAVRSGAKLLIINGRISDQAFARYRRWKRVLPPVLRLPDHIMVQTDVARQRFEALGAPPERVVHGGNLKYDFAVGEAAADLQSWITKAGASEVWIAASTMPPRHSSDCDEDEVFADAFSALAREFPRLLGILVPRKPERFDSAAALLDRRGIAHVRRSALGPVALPGVLVLDTIGELAPLFRFADVVFMGGSLVDRGGHNILEPAFYDKPVVSGSHLENFPEIAAQFRGAGALVEARAPGELAPAVARLLRDPAAAAAIGKRGGEIARSNAGATAAAVTETLRLLDLAVPRAVQPLWRRVLLGPLALSWRLGVQGHRAMTPPRRMPDRVISVGGLAMGGTGKTPMAIEVARRLRAAGKNPAFLTRGYGRQGRGEVAAGAGERIGPRLTGDEAQVLALSGIGAVGIGRDRMLAAMKVAGKYPASDRVWVLDDGFQHWKLSRDVDLVLLDALDPFGGGVFPLGRLREPFAALRRASVVVVTRCRAGRAYDGLRGEIRRWNRVVPVFLARTHPLAWVDAATGERVALGDVAGLRAIAFCGLGNPASFWQSLETAGVVPVFRHAFGDHRRYRQRDLEMLEREAAARQAGVALTTAKDVANLPTGWACARLRVLWLDIEFEVEDGGELTRLLLY